MDYTILGKNIAKMRLKNHLTQEKLAETIDVSTVFISQIETAARKPSLETVYNIANALNTTIDTLVGENNPTAKYNEIVKLLSTKTKPEMQFIINIVREICNNTDKGEITPK